MTKKKSGKLIRQPVDFPQRGKSTYSSARSPLPASKACFHARSPPDGFLTSSPDIQRYYHGNKDAYIQDFVFEHDKNFWYKRILSR
jgi:hypothetical protein